MLAAYDGWVKHPGVQARPGPGDEPHRHGCQRQEMGKTQDVEVGLVNRIDQILEPDWQVDEAVEAWDVPRESDDDPERDIGQRETRGEGRAQGRAEPFGASHRAPG